jgi:hypothetical protein
VCEMPPASPVHELIPEIASVCTTHSSMHEAAWLALGIDRRWCGWWTGKRHTVLYIERM